MQEIVKKFISELHKTKLKPAGFKKKRHHFWREKGDYIEFFEIQGSAHNSSDSPWLFYINFNVDFLDIAKSSSIRHHAGGRIGNPDQGNSGNYWLSEETYDDLMDSISKLIERTSNELPMLLVPEVKQRAEKGLLSHLPLPEWQKEF